MVAHSFWQYVRLKLIVTLLRLLNHLSTRSHFKTTPTCNRKLIRIPSRDLNRFVDAWLYYPPNQNPSEKHALVVNWHGGGCILPNLGMDHDFCERIATGGNVLVLDVDYRKAPEDPFPAAVEDAEDTLRWVESQEHQFDLDRVALSGFSSGGNLALVASSELRRDFKINIRAVYAFYPGVDFTIPPERKIVKAPIRPLPLWFQNLITEAYLPRIEDRKSPKASPMYADPAAFPDKVMLFIYPGDVLSPEAEAFGKMLKGAGRDAEVVRIEGAHGFDKASSRQLFQSGARDIAYGKVVAGLRDVL